MDTQHRFTVAQGERKGLGLVDANDYTENRSTMSVCIA